MKSDLYELNEQGRHNKDGSRGASFHEIWQKKSIKFDCNYDWRSVWNFQKPVEFPKVLGCLGFELQVLSFFSYLLQVCIPAQKHLGGNSNLKRGFLSTGPTSRRTTPLDVCSALSTSWNAFRRATIARRTPKATRTLLLSSCVRIHASCWWSSRSAENTRSVSSSFV